MRPVLVMLAVLLMALVSGCLAPTAAGREPDRPSVRIEGLPFSGEPRWLNTSMHSSPVPGEVAPILSPDEPHNCFIVDDVTAEKASFLGGFLVNLTWESVSPATAELSLAIRGPPTFPSEFHAEGPSPLTLVEAAGDEKPIPTPFTVHVAPVGGVPLADQRIDLRLATGILESNILELGWEQCGSVQLPVPV